MRNKKNKVILLILIVVLGLVLLFLYYKREKVHTLKIYDTDTKGTNIYQYVIKNNDTIFNGKCIQYNRKGTKIAELNFVNGDVYGKSVYYFDNGKIESIHFMKNSKTIMESIWYYPNGKIRKYLLFDDLGKTAFLIHYDEQGNVKNHKGLPFVEIYQYKIAHKEQFKTKINQQLKVGDVLKYKYLLANIPNAKCSFKIELEGSDNTKIKRKITKNPPVGIDVEEVLTKKGKNGIKAVVEYRFNDSKKTIVKDSVYFEVNVN
jgi:antitoxin component YwqK of YwqJK toxin-antitoxin module